MEKYSRWRDAGTGIQPFLPPVPPRTESSLLHTMSNVVHYIVCPIQGIVKLLIVAIITLAYVLFVPVLGTLFSPLAFAHRLWTRFFSALLLRLVLFFSGFFYIKTETISLRKGRGTNSTKPQFNVCSGDIVVSNWTSYIDILYLACRWDPVFTQIFPVENKVCRVSLWQAIRLCGSTPIMSAADAGVDKKDLWTLKELAKKAKEQHWGPVIVFPEGTPSNGRALLQFSPIFKDFKSTDRGIAIHGMAFKYEYSNLPPSYTVGNMFFHYASICSQFYNYMTIKQLSDEDTPCSASKGSLSGIPQSADFSSFAASDDWVGSQLISSLSTMARLRKTHLGMEDKRAFMNYYNQHGKKQRTA
ncbi:hypothetical protein J3Q64DRAFT_1013733 [Phycomyces blakesleeanus]|uniref:Phospholipid/glycerol acyltransferase domain-containing protein n=2 Tax=Phycomyces blakesleeanus TaxID=4837 RepID=A0A163B0Z5_PHYB8|nr:hypothetical protein PHYBLDRAFT_185584 [Phycomyces blakesleeanus NRRL 1555(-)]OAD77651.1 hypothetical protein PHYBLDRAFT_185584 [Phycomyces blakesleeanus NRRL 1555(-)]|eukprot:XP_018295691.1 hypothetical protein PHYBLDRAFT_185584 [Phycomyces blakesleeanus NRRL 1555(-)]